MKTVSITRFVIITTIVLASNEVLYADELRGTIKQPNAAQAIELDYRRGLAVDAASIGDTDGVRYSGYVAPNAPCACSNLNSVTVICEDCDKESDVSRCFTHDRACQDAAQAGGIREHSTFFCTAPD